jgi:rfaE bifunctional protein kinase chain/domain
LIRYLQFHTYKSGTKPIALNIESILKQFSRLKVVVVGDVMLDVYLRGSVNRISPEAPVPVVSVEEKDERPGGAANVALNLKMLGAMPILCSVIGNDEAGRSLIRILKKNKIGTSSLLTSASRITTLKTRVLSRNHQMIRYDSEMTSDLLKKDEQAFIKAVSDVIIREKPHALIFEDYNKGILTEKVIETIIRKCRSKKIFTAVDPKKKQFFAYKNVDLFKPNLREIREALQQEAREPDSRSLTEITGSLKQLLPHNITLITLSEHGIFYASHNESGIIPAHQRSVSDVSGAGDTVIAVATLALSSGLSLPESAALSNIAGGLVCEHAGVIPITREMLMNDLKTRA